jgi:hypothetical protein
MRPPVVASGEKHLDVFSRAHVVALNVRRPASLDAAAMKAGRRRGVLVAAFQSEREEETRDRAERGSAVRGSDQASVAPKRTPSRLTGAEIPKTNARNYSASMNG